VAPVPGFDRFLQKLDAYPKDQLQALTAYQAADGARPARALLVIGNELYDLSLDGAIARRVPMSGVCQDRSTVTKDGRWLLCANGAGIISLDLQTPPPQNSQLVALNTASATLPNGDQPRHAAWGPDQRHFIVGLFAPQSCVLGVYVADPPYAQAQPVVKLTFPQLTTAEPCDIRDVGWSPDGQWLAFIAPLPFGVGAINHLFALELRAFPLPQGAATDANSAIAVPSSAIADLGGAGETLTWPATPHTITMAGYQSIFEVDLLTHQRHTVLAQQGVQFCTASWTPDGAMLVFILCRPGTNPDVASAPLAQLYTYTPTSATSA
jgi:hypothetical protein